MINMEDIQLSKEQENCISYTDGDLVVNGVPGSGKSVVLMHRAVELYKACTNVRNQKVVWLTTYGKVLTKYIQDTFKKGNLNEKSFQIKTMDSYCSSIYCSEFGWIHRVGDKERLEYIGTALQNHYQRTRKQSKFYTYDVKFWAEEFVWIKQKHIMTPEEYVVAERTGRGGTKRILREDRRFVYELFREYCAVLKEHGKMDMEDVYITLLDTKKDLSQYKYDYVLVDEGQDLSYVKLKVARMLCKKDITIAADKAQKIYKTGFTWKELGIDISKSGSKNLHKSFRSTKQIVQLAESLSEINRALASNKGEYTDPVYPTRIGNDYPFIVACSNKTNEKDFIIGLISEMLEKPITIGVLYRDYGVKEEIEGFLKGARIPYEDIKQDNQDWSLDKPGVKLVTMHSSKGLEFDTVIIPLFNASNFPSSRELEKADKEQVEEIKAQERNLLYVGMTRARYDLLMTYSGMPSDFLAEFNHDYYHYVSSQGKELEKPKRIFDEIESAKEVNSEEIVVDGDTIQVHKEGSDEIKTMYGAKIPYPELWPFIGACVGEKVRVNATTYIVDRICKEDEPETPIRKKETEKTWDEVKSNVVKKVVPYIEKLKAAQIPVATTFGPELMGEDGRVVAEGEMSWEKYHVVFLRPDQEESMKTWEKAGWKVLTFETKPDPDIFVE